MSARIIKEARTLLPGMIVMLLLIAVPAMIWGRYSAQFISVAFGLGFCIMGASSFGNEFQNRTMSLLLTQPIPRTTVWREKLTALGTGIAFGVVIFFLGLWIFEGYLSPIADFPQVILLATMTSLC